MSTDTDTPRPYLVSLSGRVYERVKILAAEAKERGDGKDFTTALREFYRRLQVYPQFGDPLIDLREQTGQIRIGIVPPLAMRYIVLEERRQVFVADCQTLSAVAGSPASINLRAVRSSTIDPRSGPALSFSFFPS